MCLFTAAMSHPTQVSLTNGKSGEIHTSVAAEETVDTQTHHIMIIQGYLCCSDYVVIWLIFIYAISSYHNHYTISLNCYIMKYKISNNYVSIKI
jgi:hypothetical protein